MFFSGTASAQLVMRPPPAIAMDVIRTFDDAAETARMNMTWKLSPDDPDQTVGAWEYRWVVNGTITAGTLATAAVPGRPGWVYANESLTLSTSSLACPAAPCHFYGVTINMTDGAGSFSADACSFTLSFEVNNSHNQCGESIHPPSGLSALVAQIPSQDPQVAGAGRIDLAWRLSPDDPNQTTGEYEYWYLRNVYSPEFAVEDVAYNASATQIASDVFAADRSAETLTRPAKTTTIDTGFSTFDVTITGSRSIRFENDTIGGNENQGIRRNAYETLGVGEADHHFRVQARDNKTLQRSDWSCLIFVDQSKLFGAAACGEMPRPAGEALGVDDGFPLVDTALIAAQTGAPVGLISALVGVMFVAGLTLLGFKYASAPGGVAMAIMGVGLTTLTGIFPSWGLVVAFMLGMSAIIFMRRGSGGST